MNTDQLTRAEDLLRDGNTERGWPLWEKSRAALAPYVPEAIPVGLYGARELRWNEPITPGTEVVVLQEGGNGDTFMVARYAQSLANEGAKVIWQSPPSMYRLLRTVPGMHQVLDYSVPVHAHWRWIRSMSLPARYGIGTGAPVPYIRPRLFALLRGAREDWLGLRVTSGPATPGGRERDLPGSCARWLAEVLAKRYHVVDLNLPDGTSWTETASLMARCSKIVTVDTGVAHLAGALGRPTLIMLNHRADWRWGKPGTTTTPWYPTARLFWATRNSWDEAVQEVEHAI